MALHRLPHLVGTVALAAAVLAGCGDDTGPFDERVADVRAAVAVGDREAAERALDELAFVAGASVSDGSLSQAEADEIIALVESSRALLDEIVPTTTTTTTTTTTAPPDDDEKEEKGEKKGRDKDEEDDDDD